MKKNILYYTSFFVFATGLIITLNSNSSGPGGNRSGAPGANGNCGGCHGSNTDLNAKFNFEILDNGSTVQKFKPGQVYDLKLTANASMVKKGFNLSIINGANSKAGNLSDAGSGTQIYNAGSQQIWSHNTPGNGVWTSKWTAPTTEANVKVYASIVLANGNGNNSGDYVHNLNWSYDAEISNQLKETNLSKNAILKNPCGSEINFKEDVLWLNISTVQGRLIQHTIGEKSNFDISHLPNGTYFIQYQNGDLSLGNAKIIKN